MSGQLDKSFRMAHCFQTFLKKPFVLVYQFVTYKDTFMIFSDFFTQTDEWNIFWSYIYIWNRRNYFSNIFSLQIQFLIQTMGNTVTNSSREKKSKKNCKVEFYNKLKTSEVGQELVACSFGAWCREQRKVCGFSDKADYTSSRHSLLQPSGSPNRPDTTEGRFFRSGFK